MQLGTLKGPKSRAAGCIGAVLVLTSGEASAAELFAKHGSWEIVKSEDSCSAASSFEGPGSTELIVMKFPNGEMGTLVTNLNWSAKDDEIYQVTFVLNGTGYSGNARGTSDYVRSGFVTKFGSEFGRDFAQGSSLQIFLREQRIQHLSLAGTAAAMQAVERCLVRVRAEIAAAQRERARFADIPRDPFASPPPAAIPAGDPRPENMMIWAQRIATDYPSIALREGKSGTVEYTVSVNASGRVSDCRVTKSSGASVLDQAACRGLMRYARFIPARNGEGENVEGQFSGRIQYTLPQ